MNVQDKPFLQSIAKLLYIPQDIFPIKVLEEGQEYIYTNALFVLSLVMGLKAHLSNVY